MDMPEFERVEDEDVGEFDLNPWFFVYFNNIYFMNVECIIVQIVERMV